MNKKDLIAELMKQTHYSEDICRTVVETFENHFFLSSKGQEEILTHMKQKLSLSQSEIELLFQQTKDLISQSLKNRMLHPFGNQKTNK